MSRLASKEEWGATKVIAEMWWCGDEVCDCTQPIVERITPNLDAGYPWIRRERLWEGTFHSQADHEETVAQWRELLDAQKRLNAAPWYHDDDVPKEARAGAARDPGGET